MITEYIRKPKENEIPIFRAIQWDGKEETFQLIKKIIDFGDVKIPTQEVFTCFMNGETLMIQKQEFFGIGASYTKAIFMGEFVVGIKDKAYCATYTPEEFENEFLRYNQPKK